MRYDTVPILMYHGLHDDAEDAGHYHPIYSVRTVDFIRQIDYLIDSGYRSVRMGDVGAIGKRVLITFDDGDVSNVSAAVPLLSERGLVAEFFIVSDAIGKRGRVGGDDGHKFVDAGMGVQSHGRTHRSFDDLSGAALEGELIESRAAVEAWSGERVCAVSLPGGRGGRRERLTARRLGYSYMLNSAPGVNGGWTSDEYLNRIAVTRDMPLDTFRHLVEWNGLAPYRARARYEVLQGAKRVLGGTSYERVRASWFASRRKNPRR
jgi:peptidoglycan/xylan/chitin deacetylase (PgdA/CDA1 family)